MPKNDVTPQQIIEQSTDQQFYEHLLKMSVGHGITLPEAAYVQHILMRMYPEERENMGPKMFARNILIWRTVARYGEEGMDVAHRLLTTLDPTASYFNVDQFMRQVEDRL